MMPAVSPPCPPDLLARFAALPAAGPLLERLAGNEAVYVVGGAVRDLLRGGAPADLDLVVEGELEPVVARLGTPARTHDRFGTGTLVLDGFRYDVARAREEAYDRPGALPRVAPAGIEQDMLRRDFAANAVALGLSGPARGRLVQAPHGIEDVEAGVLRVLHDASFRDDPTRLLRLARYVSRLGFTVEPHTRGLVAAAVRDRVTDTVTGSRLGGELRLLAAEPDPAGALTTLTALGVAGSLEAGFGLEPGGPAAGALRLLPGDGSRGDLVLAAALLGVASERRGPLLARLAFPAASRDRILAAADRAAALARALATAGRPSAIAAAVGSAEAETVALAGALGDGASARAAEAWLTVLRHVTLEISGQDLVSAGIAPGPAVGAGLRGARAAKLDGRVRGREAELAEAMRIAGDDGAAQ